MENGQAQICDEFKSITLNNTNPSLTDNTTIVPIHCKEDVLKETTKPPTYRLSKCGDFPLYEINGKLLKNEKLIYLVSVGKEKFEDNWVLRFVNFIKEMKFTEKVTVIIADSLQRFNIEVDKNCVPTDAYAISVQLGNTWEQKYKPYFDTIEKDNKGLCEFIHWDVFIQDKHFNDYLNLVNQLCEKDTLWSDALKKSATEYLNRPSRNEKVNETTALINSCLFLKEECAAFMIMAQFYNGIVYPSAVTDILHTAITYINEIQKRPFFWLELKPSKNKKSKFDQSKTSKSNDLKTPDVNGFYQRKMFFETSINEPSNSNDQESSLRAQVL